MTAWDKNRITANGGQRRRPWSCQKKIREIGYGERIPLKEGGKTTRKEFDRVAAKASLSPIWGEEKLNKENSGLTIPKSDLGREKKRTKRFYF